MPEQPCVFCAILAGELPAEMLWEDQRVIAILDTQPIHYGHALVIPRRHCTDLLTLGDEDLAAVLGAARRVARALVAGLNLEGFNLVSNNGRIAGQSVFHFHMHIIPRYADDNIRFVPQLMSYTSGAMQETARRIRRHLPAPHQ